MLSSLLEAPTQSCWRWPSHVISVVIAAGDEEEKHTREVMESKDKLTVTALDGLTIF